MYDYQGDTKAGDVNGDGVGKNWFVAKADYTVMVSYTQLVGQDGQQYTSLGKAGQEQSRILPTLMAIPYMRLPEVNPSKIITVQVMQAMTLRGLFMQFLPALEAYLPS